MKVIQLKCKWLIQVNPDTHKEEREAKTKKTSNMNGQVKEAMNQEQGEASM